MSGALTAAVAAVVLACGAAVPSPAAVRLRIVVHDGQGGTRTATLTCRGATPSATGFLRGAPARHCRSARRLAPFLGSAPDPDRICTQIYGRPQTARVTGTIGGRAVERRFERTDGCAIADWNRARDLLGGPPG